MKNVSYFKIVFIFLVLTICSCKQEFLDSKPSSDIIQPKTIAEFQAILDNGEVNNFTSGLTLLSADEYEFTSESIWQASTPTSRNSYIWRKDLFEGEANEAWNKPFSSIFYSNSVLAELEIFDVTALNKSDYEYTKGWALFNRAFGYYDLVTNFSKPYDSNTSTTDLGVPLRLRPSVDDLQTRSSVSEIYNQVISDLENASSLIKISIAQARNRPSKAAVYAMFARIYLNMRLYDKAELYADSCLRVYDKLIDYKSLSKTAQNPFSFNNDEQIYHGQPTGNATYATTTNNAEIKVSNSLISLFSPNDLRLVIYFRKQLDNTFDFKGSYGGLGIWPFTGLATDEVYLIKAECSARRGNVNEAMGTLNKLLIKRWDPNATIPSNPFIDKTATDSNDALNIIITERRKELAWRGLRWQDIKRLNQENSNIVLTRTVGTNIFSLPKNDPKYVFPIPDNEIALSGIQQNQR
jgi:tetratricopeptide (TPR) repeat protein